MGPSHEEMKRFSRCQDGAMNAEVELECFFRLLCMVVVGNCGLVGHPHLTVFFLLPFQCQPRLELECS